ncbi:hypothetical protein DEU56DRAFT_913036 [Suillus clintonianus]|uniref:uncharacterized protein n=1 Tax=Suillus clintonianus TaxID=1904413 RepID=UPI001B8618D1|nr:uncharacterized protein DEU56DRAFT_913036 [Suillus clintonianus]KAG2136460.1 hypothetical protein DEU56DRAFT_913036 [Suillus clintonianus]
MTAANSHHTIVFGESTTSANPTETTPVGPLVTALAATLIIGTSHTFASNDVWSFDSCITPGPQKTIGSGDHIIVYRHCFKSFVDPLPPPVFSAVLSHIAAWGNDHVEFAIKDINTSKHHSRTIKLPLTVVRLSLLQHLRQFIFPFPRSSTPPSPINQYISAPKPLAGARAIGDRVPRDSDDLPIWDTQK